MSKREWWIGVHRFKKGGMLFKSAKAAEKMAANLNDVHIIHMIEFSEYDAIKQQLDKTKDRLSRVHCANYTEHAVRSKGLAEQCGKLADALHEITAYCNEEIIQVCPNEDCDYQALSATRSVNVCDTALTSWREFVADVPESGE